MKQVARCCLLLLTLSCFISACADLKSAGRSIGHKTRDVTRDIGHGTRDAVKSVGKATKEAVE